MEAAIFVKYFYLPMIAWLVLIVILFTFLLVKYTFGKWTKENPNPYARETLGLPRGIFRAILTLSLLFGAIVFELALMAQGSPESQISEFMVAFQMMIAFYFGSKVMHHVASNERKNTAERAKQAVETAKANGVNFQNYPTSSTPSTKGDPGSDFYDPESAG